MLARFSGAGSAMTEQPVGRGRLLIFASDLDNRWNRFPLNPAFVPWAIETARYLAQGREKRQSYTLPNIPSGISPAPGVYDLPSAAAAAKSDDTKRQAVRVAVNVDVRESNPARTSVEEFTGASHTAQSGGGRARTRRGTKQEEQQRLWQVGLVVMFLALAVRGLLGVRLRNRANRGAPEKA